MKDLKSQQDKVNSEKTHEARYIKATSIFSNKTPAAAFKEIRRVLASSSPSGDSCYYCERDRYRDIEHVRPKRHYPDRAFDWFNYVYSCVICNQDAKRDTYAVFTGEVTYIEFDRSLPFTEPVPVGDPVLIDPRSEDPLEFLSLDLETGSLVAIGKNDRDHVRGCYTRDLFNLDSDDLIRIRRNYVGFYTERLKEYALCLKSGNKDKANKILTDVLEMEHPTVIVEMRRQAHNYPLLQDLFLVLPESIGQWPKQIS